MLILALDGALARCSAAVLDGDRLAAHRIADAARGHASLLPPMAAEVLQEAGVRATELDAIAVGVGPGGFTGLRAALALAQGVALASAVPLIGVTTGEALAAALPAESRRIREVWSVVDNRRGRVVLERFSPGAEVPLGPPEAVAEDALPAPSHPVAVAGDAAPAVAARLAERGYDVVLTEARLPDAHHLARVGARRLAGRLPPREAVPLYVEPPAVRPAAS